MYTVGRGRWPISTCTALPLETAGLFDYLAEGAIVAVEWSELAQGWFRGEKAVHVDIRRGEAEDERIITIEEAGL